MFTGRNIFLLNGMAIMDIWTVSGSAPSILAEVCMARVMAGKPPPFADLCRKLSNAIYYTGSPLDKGVNLGVITH